MMEQAVVFGEEKSLIGIVTEPVPSGGPLPAVVILNAGLLPRVGPNRLHVHLARAMASAGFLALRFDFSGVGDSPARSSGNNLEEGTVRETQEAMDFLERNFRARGFLLLGLCSGADTAFRTACQDPRVVGIVGINGSYLDANERGRMQAGLSVTTLGRYYRRQLLNPHKWWRCATGKSNIKQLLQTLQALTRANLRGRSHRPPSTSFLKRCHELVDRRVHLLLLYSEGSTSLDALRSVHGQRPERLHSPPALEVRQTKDTDHVFTLLWAQQTLVQTVTRWAQEDSRCWMSDGMARVAGERLSIVADGNSDDVE